jgi:hypothetical protein
LIVLDVKFLSFKDTIMKNILPLFFFLFSSAFNMGQNADPHENIMITYKEEKTSVHSMKMEI